LERPALFELAAIVVASSLFVAGCKGDPETKNQWPALSAAPARSVPVDQIKPGELAEGDERAFGFPIPRRMRVRGRFPDSIVSDGRVSFEELSNYVRERVTHAKVSTGPERTVFDGANPMREPSKTVRIEVTRHNTKVELVVRDRTRKPAEPGLSDEERWRRTGVSPDGKMLPGHNE
jgi:hypothetical protein